MRRCICIEETKSTADIVKKRCNNKCAIKIYNNCSHTQICIKDICTSAKPMTNLSYVYIGMMYYIRCVLHIVWYTFLKKIHLLKEEFTNNKVF